MRLFAQSASPIVTLTGYAEGTQQIQLLIVARRLFGKTSAQLK
jgi:hypothetical protein